MVPTCEALIRTFGNQQFLETRGSKIWNHERQCLGTFGTRKFLELGICLLPRLGSIGSNAWEPAVPRTANLCANDFKLLGIAVLQSNMLYCSLYYNAYFLVFDVGLVSTCRMLLKKCLIFRDCLICVV